MPLQKYIIVFIITAAIFGTAFYLATSIDRARIADIRTTEERIAIDILSSETQFELLGSLDCKTISQNPILSSELNSIASRLSVAEENLGNTNPEVVRLKKQYSLLQIKDYLLMQQVSQKCNLKPVFVLYFYSNSGNCPECGRAGDVLTYLRTQYPGLRVYSFDYNLDLSALRTLISLRGLDEQLPALVINNRPPVYGFKTFEEIQVLIPELKTLSTTSAATSTRQR
jgi:hypothetical protein